jgi:hypothetical protein
MRSMNKLTTSQRAQVINCLIEGFPIRATVRMTGVAKKAVVRLLVEVGEVGGSHQDRVLRNLPCRSLHLDELWRSNNCKGENGTPEVAGRIAGAGDVWLWVPFDAGPRLVPCWRLGDRDSRTAMLSARGPASRPRNRVQITAYCHKVYSEAVKRAFGSEADYAIPVKMYGSDRESEIRYGPADCIGTQTAMISGKTGRSALPCEDTQGRQMGFPGKSAITRRQLPRVVSRTTSSGFTAHFGARQRWGRA